MRRREKRKRRAREPEEGEPKVIVVEHRYECYPDPVYDPETLRRINPPPPLPPKQVVVNQEYFEALRGVASDMLFLLTGIPLHKGHGTRALHNLRVTLRQRFKLDGKRADEL